MIKTKFLFAVSFVALLVVNNSYAANATDLVPVGQRVAVGTAEAPNYLGDEMEIPQSLVEYMAEHPWDGYTTTGIAGVTYVNKAVGAAGNAAQWAENRAAAAADSAILAQVAAEDAAASADDANDAVAKKFDNTSTVKKAIVTTDKDGNVAPVVISDKGTGAFVSGVTVGDDGAVTLTRGDVTMPTVDTALSSNSTNAVQNKVVTSALDGKVDKITTDDAEKDTMLVMDETGELLYVKPEVYSVNTAATAVVTDMEISGGSFQFTRQPFPTATASVAGISALGTIPSGADKAGTATIWVE